MPLGRMRRDDPLGRNLRTFRDGFNCLAISRSTDAPLYPSQGGRDPPGVLVRERAIERLHLHPVDLFRDPEINGIKRRRFPKNRAVTVGIEDETRELLGVPPAGTVEFLHLPGPALTRGEGQLLDHESSVQLPEVIAVARNRVLEGEERHARESRGGESQLGVRVVRRPARARLGALGGFDDRKSQAPLGERAGAPARDPLGVTRIAGDMGQVDSACGGEGDELLSVQISLTSIPYPSNTCCRFNFPIGVS